MRTITFIIAMVVLGLSLEKANAAEFASREDAVSLVKRTIALIKQEGIEPIAKAVNNKDTRFWDRDLYVYISDLRVPGSLVAHGTNVNLVGKNTIDLKDQNGKFFVRELNEVAKTQGSGWVDYRWANAEKTEFADKTAYVERVGNYYVAVGVYKTEAPNENTVGIISGNPSSTPTYLQIAYDMSVILNDGNNLRVVPVIGIGGVQNIRDVRLLKGIDIGLTQSNILNSFRRTGQEQLSTADGNKIVYITKLFNEEVHVIARTDITSISQLRGKKVNIDEAGSGTAFTMRDIFKNLGIDIIEVNVNQADAIDEMKKGEIAATILVGGKPVLPFKNIQRADGFHLLPVPYAPALQKDYLPDGLSSQDYPELIPEGGTVETVAVSAVLIAYNWRKDSDRYRRVAKFVLALFSKIDQFQKSSRHPKWRDVNLASTLPGWERFEVAETLLANGSLPTQASFDQFLATKGVLHKATPEQRVPPTRVDQRQVPTRR